VPADAVIRKVWVFIRKKA